MKIDVEKIRIVDNKKLALTEKEWTVYNDICQSYNRPNFKGSDLFIGLFESDDEGQITFIKSPSNRRTSMEVFLYLVAIYEHQGMRRLKREMDARLNDIEKRFEEKLNRLEK